MDFTKDAPSIGLTIRQFTKQQPNYKPNDFHALMYFFGREPYLETYIASRLELMKEITADRHIPSKLIRRLMEAK